MSFFILPINKPGPFEQNVITLLLFIYLVFRIIVIHNEPEGQVNITYGTYVFIFKQLEIAYMLSLHGNITTVLQSFKVCTLYEPVVIVKLYFLAAWNEFRSAPII